MKKIVMIFCALGLVFGLSAQNFGVQVGMNMSSLSGEEMEDLDMKMGINGGVVADFSFSDVMSLKTGALYSTKGAQMEDSGIKMSLALSYIEVPLNIGYSVSDQISLMAGPYIGLLMSAKSKVSGSFLGEDIDEEEDVKEDFAGMDFGINLGASFSINESISIGAGYQLGLADLGSEGDADATNSNIHISVAYMFGGGYY